MYFRKWKQNLTLNSESGIQYFPFTFDTTSNSDFSSNEIRGTIFQSEGAKLETPNVYNPHILDDIQRLMDFSNIFDEYFEVFV